MALSDFILNRKFVKKVIDQQVQSESKKITTESESRIIKIADKLNTESEARFDKVVKVIETRSKLRSIGDPARQFQEDRFKPANDKDFLRAYETYHWVYTAVFAIATNCAKIPFRIYKKTKSGEKGEEDKSGFFWNLFNMPNPFQSYYEFIEAMVTSLELVGDSFVEKDNPARPSQMYVMRPDFMKTVGSRSQLVDHYEYGVYGTIERFDPEFILHLKYYHPRSEIYGLAPAEAAQNSIVLDLFSITYQKNFFKQGAQLSMYLKTPDSLSDEDFQRLKQEVRTNYMGVDRHHKIGVLDNNAELVEVGVSPEKTLLKEQRLMNRDEILAAYGVPPLFVGLTDAGTYQNTREQKMQFWEGKAQPVLKRIQDKFNAEILWPNGFTGEFDFSGVQALQEDQDKKSKVATSLVKGGIFTPNEARADFYQKDAKPGGDDLIIVTPGAIEKEAIKHIGKSARREEIRKIGIQQFNRLYGDQVDKLDKILDKFFDEYKKQIIENVSKIKKTEVIISKDIVDDATKNLEALETNMLNEIRRFEKDTSLLFFNRNFKRLTQQDPTDQQIQAISGLLEEQTDVWARGAVDSISTTIKKDITTAMGSALKEGEGLTELTARIRDAFEGSARAKFSRARQIARTEMLRVGNFSNVQSAKSAGFEKKEWVAAGPPNDREFHTAIDRETVGMDDTFSNGLRFPGDPDGPAEQVINCFPAGVKVLTNRGEIEIQNVRSGDLVLTHRNRWKPVIERHISPVKRGLVRVNLANGDSFRITPAHKLYVIGKGWVEAGNLESNDKLIDPESLSFVNNAIGEIEHPHPELSEVEVAESIKSAFVSENLNSTVKFREKEVDVISVLSGIRPVSLAPDSVFKNKRLLRDNKNPMGFHPVFNNNFPWTWIKTVMIKTSVIGKIILARCRLFCSSLIGTNPLGPYSVTSMPNGYSFQGQYFFKSPRLGEPEFGHNKSIPPFFRYVSAFKIALDRFTDFIFPFFNNGLGHGLVTAGPSTKFLFGSPSNERFSAISASQFTHNTSSVNGASLHYNKVQSVSQVSGKETVYNLGVEEDMSYFAGGCLGRNCRCTVNFF